MENIEFNINLEIKLFKTDFDCIPLLLIACYSISNLGQLAFQYIFHKTALDAFLISIDTTKRSL